MQPFRTHSSLGIDVPSTARCHSVTHPARLMAFVSHPRSVSSPRSVPSSAPPQRFGEDVPTQPCLSAPRHPQGPRGLDFPVVANIPLTLARRSSLLWRSRVTFFHPEHSCLCPLHPPAPCSLPAKLAGNTTGFSSPLEQMFHLLLLVQMQVRSWQGTQIPS